MEKHFPRAKFAWKLFAGPKLFSRRSSENVQVVPHPAFLREMVLGKPPPSLDDEKAHNLIITQIENTLFQKTPTNPRIFPPPNINMTGSPFFLRLGDLADRSKFASDPINLTHSNEQDHGAAKENSMRIFMKQNSIAVYENNTKETSSASANRVTKQPYSSLYRLETIRDAPEHHEQPFVVESRDDHSVPSLIDEDLIIAHPFGRSSSADQELREEAIEIINISFLHE